MKLPSIIRSVLLTITAIAAWYGLVLQLYLIIDVAQQKGIPVFGEVLRFFSYFTILTNLLVALSVSAVLWIPQSRVGRFFAKPAVQTGIAIYILVVGVTYSVALRHIWNPQGLQAVADHVLHDIVPVLYVLYWVFFVPKNYFRWSDPLWWLVYPFLYLVYTMVRGQLTAVYPYYFLDPALLDWPGVWTSILVLFAGFSVLGFLVVGISRFFYSQ